MSMLGAVLFITLPIALVIFVVSAIVKSVRKDNANEESFQNIIRTMYIYIIMIIFLVLFVGATISLFDSSLQLLLPEKAQSAYESSTVVVNRTIADITTNIAILCISIPMFVYFSTLAKKEHKAKEIVSKVEEVK